MKYTELDDGVKAKALDNAFDVWWQTDDAAEFRKGEFDDWMFNFLESTELSRYDDVVTFEAADEMVWRGTQSDPVGKLTWHQGQSWDDPKRLRETLRHVMDNDTTSSLIEGVRTYAEPDEIEDVAVVVFDAIAKKAAFHFFNWLDLQDAGYEYLSEMLSDGRDDFGFDFDEEGNLDLR